MRNLIYLILVLTGLSEVLTERQKRSPESTATIIAKKEDLQVEGTIVDPYYGEPGLIHGGYPVGGVAHLGGLYGPGQLGPGLVNSYAAPFYKTGGDFRGSLIHSGINEGALALGNQGQQVLQQQIGAGYGDGSYHAGGLLKEGGYGGGEIYRDDKNHLADENYNKGYFNGVEGGRKDLGGGELYGKNQKFAQNGVNQYGRDALNGYKKGHQKTGFRKSYHKDESGGDESFYDSDHDEGNHEVGNRYGDYYNNNGLSSANGGTQNNLYAAHNKGELGEVGLGKVIARNQGIKDYIGNDKYYGNNNGYGQYGGNGFSKFGKLGGQHGYVDNFNRGRNYAAYRDDGFNRGLGFGGPYY